MKLQFYPESRVLITPTIPVTEFGYELKRLCHGMVRMAIDNDGVGLSAPQIGLSERIFVYRTDRIYTSWSGANPVWQHVINPVIRWYSPDKVTMEEGCLSLPGLYGNVERSGRVWVDYYNALGVHKSAVLSGIEARIFQHEYDHLDGWLFPFYNIPGAVKGKFKPLSWSFIDELTNNKLEAQKI